jgi:hypothetical protein
MHMALTTEVGRHSLSHAFDRARDLILRYLLRTGLRAAAARLVPSSLPPDIRWIALHKD